MGGQPKPNSLTAQQNSAIVMAVKEALQGRNETSDDALIIGMQVGVGIGAFADPNLPID